ncbi:AT-rich interactive domain-containing protein 5B-like isoform X2 [Ostrinia furnacalis]|uniref:AT-rich interactive domain-containing protein 5B-like isoform X1 n=1 Tax=Ostrinia furnacalis TaxID=93504 RepID=UPI00103A7673|nr:AT-rich interactive domain-containing protein 5B-like isoform X1 [Ostrinia furnacalis]XP_028161003.1 AT-rich interactive domain-containing protein 5B-like isoform X2 [Ostrinia furnacalis]
MEKPTFKLVGSPCGHHGQYTFYKAIRLCGEKDRIIAIGDFFFVRIWQDSELVSVGELQLLWTDRISGQTLVSLRLYFLPENTPDGRSQHGEDEVLAINEKVVLRADDLLSWVCNGEDWRWGLRAVWRGACAPPADPRHTAPLHHTKLDFSDVEKEKNSIVDPDSPGVVVFSYPRYCRYRALLSRLEGVQGDWLRDSLVAALGGYAAPTHNTRILYCKDTFEYAELEGHEFVCNQFAPKLKGRPRGRRRRPPRAGDPSPTPSPERPSSEHDSDDQRSTPSVATPRRLSLRNGADRHSDEDDYKREETKEGKREEKRDTTLEDRAFLLQLRQFYRERNESMHGHTLKDLSLRVLYESVTSRGGYEAVCRHKLWRALSVEHPARARRHYERFLLPYENHSRRNGLTHNGRLPPRTVATIDVTSPPRSPPPPSQTEVAKRLRTPSPVTTIDNETGESKEELNLISKPAEELNREFLESLPKDEKPLKISVKPVEKLIEAKQSEEAKESERKPSEASGATLNELAHKLNLSNPAGPYVAVAPETRLNGHDAKPLEQQKTRPAGRSSLRAVRVKPTRPQHTPANTPPIPPARGSPPPLTNFGIHHPPPANHSDDEIVEVPYKPKTPEIIDLDEYPESPISTKKKKLDILKERGLEVTAIPTWPLQPPITPLLNPTPMLLNPAVQHQIMTQAQIFQMYNIIPPNYNGAQPPKVIQATSLYGSSGPEKTVYGNPKDPFMPPPHILTGTPVKPQRNIPTTTTPPQGPQDILDLTCKSPVPSQKPAVEIVRIPTAPSPSKNSPQNLSKNYTLIDGKAVVGSNLEITLVNPRVQTPNKNRQNQKRSSNGKFVSSKTPTPPKENPKQFPSPSGLKKNPIVVPNYQINSRDNVSPTSSTGSRDSQTNSTNVFKPTNLAQILEMQKSVPSVPLMDPVYMSALYSSLGNLDQRQLTMYRDFMASQMRYTGLLNMGVGTPTTKN